MYKSNANHQKGRGSLPRPVHIPPVLCVTNRRLCREPFLERIERIAAAGVQGIVLREKDLNEQDYAALAAEVAAVCDRYETLCILHSHAEAARSLRRDCLHMPLPLLRRQLPAGSAWLGASVHSREEALEALSLGANHLTAGHIFATDCKKGLPPRGLDFLREICALTEVPVYAIGGITPERIGDVLRAGAAGACLMSGLMQCEDPARYLERFLPIPFDMPSDKNAGAK